MFEDKPVREVLVSFHGDGSEAVAFGTTDESGKFCVNTPGRGQGIPVGEYRVCLVAPMGLGRAPAASLEYDRLGGRYRNASQPFTTLTITSETSTLDDFVIEASGSSQRG
ncbi:MAG: hypothetical protein KDA93_06840 [Planctomycetaceae bacterium]|nr:hypothetical protein [Planctomycetaceae bacterium]